MPRMPQKGLGLIDEGDQDGSDQNAPMHQWPSLHHHRNSRTDFATWDRKTLESFARAASQEIIDLNADLKVAISAYRRLMKEEK